MANEFFDWSEFAKENNNLSFPFEAIEEVFLMDCDTGKLWLSKKLSSLLYFDKDELKTEISFDEFSQFMLGEGQNNLHQEVRRLIDGKAKRVNCHVSVIHGTECLSAVCYVFPLKLKKYLLGFLSIDYVPIQEYEKHLEEVIQQMKHAQNVNELVLEGATDYIFQYDVVNDICTFSPKVLDVLAIESPTISNAVGRYLSFIVPEDRQLFLDALTPFLSGKSDDFEAKYRITTKQGELMWLLNQGKGLRDASGAPIMLAGSMVDITEQQKKEERINQMLYVDALTGLRNRLCFEKEMEEYLKKDGVKGALVQVNIRKFKLFNELFGRNYANEILQDFARQLELYFPGALGIYRIGGDEFLLHLEEYNHDAILGRMVPFQSSLKKPRELGGHSLYISIYAAVVTYPEHGENVEELLHHVNQCLMRMSRKESEEISFFAAQDKEDISQQYILENVLRKDIQNDFKHFRVVYQPIVHVENGKACWEGAEALLRYQNPELPNVGQMEMIQTLEYSGLILSVGRWVLAQAVRECSKWNQAGHKAVVHVNMAAQQITDTGFVNYVREQCQAAELDPSSLVVELTETSLVNNMGTANQLCQELMRMGVGVALDDFGTGYSGFTYLRKLPISQIKVDREYARDLHRNHYNQVIVSFIYNLSEDMGVDLCVEGVEQEEELQILQNMGVSTIQGFYFERPMEKEIILKEFIDRAVAMKN